MFSFKYLGMDVSHRLVEKPMADSNPEYESHYHEDCIEVYVFMGGSARMVVENQQRELRKNDLVIIMPYSLHRLEILEDIPYECMDFKLPSTFIGEFIAERLKAAGVFHVWPAKVVFLDLMDEFYEEYRAEGDSDEMLYLGFGMWLAAILAYLCRKDSRGDAPETENVLVSEIKKYVENNLNRKITMQDLCDYFHRSPSFIGKQFREATGESVMSYIRNYKMKFAQYLIDSNDTKPTDAAKALGYTDYSSFYKAYMSVNGKAPNAKAARRQKDREESVEQ